MKVTELPRTNLADVALQLRRLADWIEQARDAQLTCIVVLGRASQEVHVYGFGARVSGLETQGWLARAQSHVDRAVESWTDSDGRSA